MDLENNDKVLEAFIRKITNQYNIEHNTNLNIESVIIRKNESSEAKFLIHDLYTNKLVMYVDEEMWNYGNEYITAIIYHELTHAADSQKFNKLSEDNFFEIMKIYSETHASQVQFEKMLSYCQKPTVSSFLYYKDAKILLESFMQQSIDKIVKEINRLLDETNIIQVEYNDITYIIYYLSGYLLALKNKAIEYTPDLSNIPKRYKLIVSQTIEYLSSNQCENYNIEKIQNYHSFLISLIEEDNKKIQDRYEDYTLQIKKNTCPKCNSTNVTYKEYTGFINRKLKNKSGEYSICNNCGHEWQV